MTLYCTRPGCFSLASEVAFLCRIALLIAIAALVFPASAGAQSPDHLPAILTIGESTTAGYGVSPELSYPSQLQSLLETQGFAYTVVNQGRSGSTSAMALNGLDRGLLLGPRIVIIALGGNDRGYGFSRARTKENLRKMVSIFVRTGAHVFIAGRDTELDGGGVETASLYAELAEEEGAILMPSLREGVGGHPELLISDGSHPNGAGYTIIARRIFDLLKPYLDAPAG